MVGDGGTQELTEWRGWKKRCERDWKNEGGGDTPPPPPPTTTITTTITTPTTTTTG